MFDEENVMLVETVALPTCIVTLGFARGAPETIAEVSHQKFTATLFDLLSAYAVQRQQGVLASVHLAKRTVWSLAEARATLERQRSWGSAGSKRAGGLTAARSAASGCAASPRGQHANYATNTELYNWTWWTCENVDNVKWHPTAIPNLLALKSKLRAAGAMLADTHGVRCART